jgi:hypothetical protein
METGVAESTVGGGCGSTAREVHGMHVARRVQGGGDQGGSVGATKGLAGATTGSDNGDAGEAGSMAGSLAASRWTQTTGLGNGATC